MAGKIIIATGSHRLPFGVVARPSGVYEFWISKWRKRLDRGQSTAMSALERRRILAEEEAIYARLFDAFLARARDGRCGPLLKTLARVELLIFDDWGLAPLTPEQGRDLLEVLDTRRAERFS